MTALHRTRRTGLVCLSTALLWSSLTLNPGSARGQGLQLRPVLQGTRVDLSRGHLLLEARPKTLVDLEALTLPPNFKLRAVRDETVSFAVLLSAATATVAPLRLSRSEPLHGAVYVAQGIRVTEPTEAQMVHSLGPANYPDPLIPTATVAVPQQGFACLWIDVFVPRDAPTKTHDFRLRVGRQTLEFSVEVLDLALPAADISGLGTVNFGSFEARAYDNPERLTRWMQMAHAHHLSVEVRLRAPPDGKGGLDWDRWTEVIEPWVTGSAFTEAAGYRGPRAGLPTSQLILPQTNSWPNPRTDDHMPSDFDAFAQALRTWERLALDRGWFDKPHATRWVFFVNSLDEPKEPEKIKALAAYGPLLKKVGLQNQKHLLFRVDGNFGQKITGYDDDRQLTELGGVVDIWNLHGADYTIPWEMMQSRRDAGEERLMMYISNSSGEPTIPPLVLDAPVNGARAWGWFAPRFGFAGLLNWEIDWGEPGCEDNLKCSPGGNHVLDANLLYRGHQVGAAYDEPIASMRVKMLRRGAQDAALWSLLAQRSPRTAQAILHSILPRAVEDGIGHEGMGAWPVSPLVYERIRERMLDALLESPNGPPQVVALRGRGWLPTLVLGLLWIAFAWFKKR